ncbi:MAG: glycosyltransferase [Acetobacteraceae bacterium]|nr:glycosyltransferase [Acetobacteraceae bacterium]
MPGTAPADSDKSLGAGIRRAQQAALAAFQNGQTALTAGQLDDALRWLERGQRLAPTDLMIGLFLAITYVRMGTAAKALPLLHDVVARGPTREAWFALAGAAHDSDDLAQAEAALQAGLSGFRLPADPGLATLADKIVAVTERPGWCGLRADGRVEIRLTAGHGKVMLLLDGAKLRRGALVALADDVAQLAVTASGVHLLGSPIDLAALRRTDGAVAARDGGLDGWAIQRRDPDCLPSLTISGADGLGQFRVRADLPAETELGTMERPRRFVVPMARIAGLQMPVHVCGADGRDLPGSPLDPLATIRAARLQAQGVAASWPLLGAKAPLPSPLLMASMPAALRGLPAQATPQPAREVAVIIPVHGAMDATRDCLDSVFASIPAGTVVIVVDDASDAPDLVRWLDTLGRQRKIRLLRHATNRGFPISVNAGLREAAGLPGKRDMVVLNSDTVVTPGWLDGLRQAVHAAADIGTATPLSNAATIMSYPHTLRANPTPVDTALADLARQAKAANKLETIEIPTAIGFCMYLRHECVVETGVFRDDLFAQGYGEENDFCLRARHLGWRHVGVPGIYVAHRGGQSFGAATASLITRNLAILEDLHPGYHALIAAFEQQDPLATARRRIDSLRWKAARAPIPARRAVVLVSHDNGGGVERVVRARVEALRAEGTRPILLRPLRGGDGLLIPDACLVSDGAFSENTTPNLRFSVPGELAELAALLRDDRAIALEVHHMLGHNHMILRLAALLAVPVDFHLHDYAMYCPRITLLGPERRYCGEPTATVICDACVADAGRSIEEDIATTTLRARSANDLAAARRVVVPSADTATRFRRHFQGIRPEILPLENDSNWPLVQVAPQKGRRRVCVIGAIGPEKGYDLLLACARDAAMRKLALEFTVVGFTVDDQRLIDTGHAFVTGRYQEADGEALVRAQSAQLAWLPAIWPETWSFALSLAWQAGLPVVAFDIGAPAERIRTHGQGWVLPLGLAPGAINTTLLGLERASG